MVDILVVLLVGGYLGWYLLYTGRDTLQGHIPGPLFVVRLHGDGYWLFNENGDNLGRHSEEIAKLLSTEPKVRPGKIGEYMAAFPTSLAKLPAGFCRYGERIDAQAPMWHVVCA